MRRLAYLFLFFASTSASSVPAKMIPLREYLDKAMENLGTESYSQSLAAETDLSARIELNWAPTDFQFGLGSFETDGQAGPYNEISITQKLPWTARRSEIKDQLTLRSRLGRIRAERKTLQIVGDILVAVQKYQHARVLSDHLKERTQLAASIKRQLRNLRNVSAADRAERAILTTRIQELELEGENTLSDLKSTRQALSRLADTSDSFELDTRDLPYTIWADAISLALRENEALKTEWVAESEIAESSRRYAKWSWLPELSVYFYQNRQRPLQFEQTQVFGIGLQIPLWGISDRIALAESQSARIQSEQRIQKAKLTQLAQVFEAEVQKFKNHTAVFSESSHRQLEGELVRAIRAFELGQLSGTTLLDLEERIHNLILKKQALESSFLKTLIETATAIRFELGREV